MGIYDTITERPQLLRDVGAAARLRAKQAGAPLFYEDPVVGEGIVEEMPDGARRLVIPADDTEREAGGSISWSSLTARRAVCTILAGPNGSGK